MNKHLILILVLFCAVFRATAQTVTVDASIDSLQILIGEQTKVQLEVTMDASQRAVFPLLTDTLVTGVEILDIARPDTQYLNNRQRMHIMQEYTITSFDSDLYYIPPFEVMVDTTVYHSNPLTLKVYTVPIDTMNTDIFFGPKPVMKAPFAWEDWRGLLLLSILCIPLLILAIYLIIRFNDNKPILRTIKIEPKLPPHEQAMKEIDRIKQEKVAVKDNPKEYYTRLTDVVRTYIKNRYGFNALEMTSSEIIEHLLGLESKESLSDLRELFSTADLVKFAKHTPLMNENDANLIHAVEFVNQTKVEVDPNAVPVPTEITIEEKRSRKTKIVLGMVIGVISVAIVAILVYIGIELYNQF
ncbi:MAG: BatD family protein [Bacteroides sp.]|nr:BatD family protein [Bacteroides sp.]